MIAKNSRAIAEAKARKEAETQLEGKGERIQTLEQELEKEMGKSSYLQRHLEDSHGKLLKEEAVRVDLEIKIQKLQEILVARANEIGKSAEALAEARKAASLSYKDCVEKYKASGDFVTAVEEKAGEYHVMGFNDCLTFIGAGNRVDPNEHSFESFLEKELAHLGEGTESAGGQTIVEGVPPELVLTTGGEEGKNQEESDDPRASGRASGGPEVPSEGGDQEVILEAGA